MTYILRLVPDVEEDLTAGYDWYESRAIGLGEEFLRMFYACANQIMDSPLAHPRVFGEFRRCLLRRFPYAIYYITAEKQVVVYGIFHCARNPVTISENLRERD